MEDHDNAVTKLSKLSFNGSKGETLNISSKHRLLPSPSGSSDEILGPENRLLELRIGVRVDRKLLKSEELLQSGFLKAVYRFFREHGVHLRIKSIDEAESGKNKTVTIPLQLEQLPEDLAPHNPSRLESIYAQFIFYSPDHTPLSRLTPDLRKQLLSTDMSPNLQSLVFRSLQKFSITLASKYPLVFNGNYTSRLIRDHLYLHVLAKSLAKMTSDLPEELSEVVHMGCKRLKLYCPIPNSQAEEEESQQISDDPEDLLEQASRIQRKARSETEVMLENALSTLARHATKRKKVFSSAEMITPEGSETGSPGHDGAYDEEFDDGSETIYGHLDEEGHLLLCSLLDDDDEDADERLAVFARETTPPNVHDDLPPENFQDTYNDEELRISQALDEYEDKALHKWSKSKRFPLPQGTTLSALSEIEVLEELLALNSSQSFRQDPQETEYWAGEASTSAPLAKRRKKRVHGHVPETQSLPPANKSGKSSIQQSTQGQQEATTYIISDDEEETLVEVTMHSQLDDDVSWSAKEIAESDTEDFPNLRQSQSSQDSEQHHDSGYSIHSTSKRQKRAYEELEDFEVMNGVEAGIAALLEGADAGASSEEAQDIMEMEGMDMMLSEEYPIGYEEMESMQDGLEDDLLLWSFDDE